MGTQKDNIIRVFEKKKRPLKATEIKDTLENLLDEWVNLSSLRVILVQAEAEGMLTSIKFKGVAKFYCKPEWVEEGKLKEGIEFDPHWNNKIKIPDGNAN